MKPGAINEEHMRALAVADYAEELDKDRELALFDICVLLTNSDLVAIRVEWLRTIHGEQQPLPDQTSQAILTALREKNGILLAEYLGAISDAEILLLVNNSLLMQQACEILIDQLLAFNMPSEGEK